MKTLKRISILLLILMMALPLFPAMADGEPIIIGEVTVTNRTSVNLRSGGATHFPIVYIGRTGELFPTTGTVEGGWYEVILPNGNFAYISPKLVLYKPFEPGWTQPTWPQPTPVDPWATPSPTPVPINYNLPRYTGSLSPIGHVATIPEHKTHSFSGDAVAVFSGPGTTYHRAANGRAALGGGRIRVYGTSNGWAMIGYGLSSGAYRIGYVDANILPWDFGAPELYFSFTQVGISSEAYFTDDPIVDPSYLFRIPAGSQVTLLAYETWKNHWAYIETTWEGRTIRGFINKQRIGGAVSGMAQQPTSAPVISTPCPQQTYTITGGMSLPEYKTFSFTGDTQAIYSGPGTTYFRAAGGRASVSGGRLRIWGTTGDWALVGYGLSNNLYRVGYLHKSAVPSDVCVPEIVFNNRVVTVHTDAPFNDDPILHPVPIFDVPAGTQVTLLAFENWKNNWAYIETTYNGQVIRGFIRRAYITE